MSNSTVNQSNINTDNSNAVNMTVTNTIIIPTIKYTDNHANIPDGAVWIEV